VAYTRQQGEVSLGHIVYYAKQIARMAEATPPRKTTGGSQTDNRSSGEAYRQTKPSQPTKIKPSIKLTIIGNSNVGKTALKERFDEGTFGIDYRATVALDLKKKLVSVPVDKNGNACTDETERVGTKQATALLFDTAGQERYDSCSRQSIRGSHGIIIVYDVADQPPMESDGKRKPTSFKDVETKWLLRVHEYNAELKDVNKHPLVLLIGNKIDLPNRTTTMQDATYFAQHEGLFYFETSAKTGDNVNIAFDTFIVAVCKKFRVFGSNPVDVEEKGTVKLGDSKPVELTRPEAEPLVTPPPDNPCAC